MKRVALFLSFCQIADSCSGYFTSHLSLTRFINYLPFARSSSSGITRAILISIVHSILFRFCSPITWVCCCTFVSYRLSNSAGPPYPSFVNLLVLSIRFCMVFLLAGHSVSHPAFTLHEVLFSSPFLPIYFDKFAFLFFSLCTMSSLSWFALFSEPIAPLYH